MNAPGIPVNRYALDNADRLFCFGKCSSTELRERPQWCFQGLKKPCGSLLLLHLFVNLLHIKDKNSGCTLEKLGSEATNPKPD